MNVILHVREHTSTVRTTAIVTNVATTTTPRKATGGRDIKIRERDMIVRVMSLEGTKEGRGGWKVCTPTRGN